MLYRPRLRDLPKMDLVNFTLLRWVRLPHQIYLGWIHTPTMLREATVRPVVMGAELKPGYYWPELIH